MGMAFFEQLEIFSLRYFQTLHIAEEATPWGPSAYDRGKPKGAVIHYTADEDIDRVVKWFMRAKYQSKASANVIISDRKYPRAADLTQGLPLIEALPVTVLQCAQPKDPTWHARAASPMTYGVELLNVGELRRNADGEMNSHWRRNHDPDEPEWTMPWANLTKEHVQACGRYWEPYTIDQLQTLVVVLRKLREVYPELDPSWVLGHECVQENKRDPGPLFPMDWVRRQVFRDGDCEDIYMPGAAVSVMALAERNDVVRRFAYSVGAEKEDSLPNSGVSWAALHLAIQALGNSDRPFGAEGKTALRLLGYHVPHHTESAMWDSDRKALWLFQWMSGLKPDQIPGPKTREALLRRLSDRGLLRR